MDKNIAGKSSQLALLLSRLKETKKYEWSQLAHLKFWKGDFHVYPKE